MIDMSTKDNLKIRDSIRSEVNRLQAVAALTTERSTVAAYQALSNEQVENRLVEKIIEGFIPQGVVCMELSESPEDHVHVIFKFCCAPDVVCVLNPSFAAVVNYKNRRVVDILDPFIPFIPRTPAPTGLDLNRDINRSRINSEDHFSDD